MHHRPVSDHAVLSHDRRETRVSMKNAAVLDVGTRPR